MNKTRYLYIILNEKLQAYEIPTFRAAIIEKTKRESDLFHNHSNDQNFIYRYPLIQYKIKNKKPSILCLNEATEDIHILLRERNFDLRLGNRVIEFEIEDMRLKYQNIQTWKTKISYNIHNFIALNQANFEIYKNLTGLAKKIELIETILLKNIQLFAKELQAYLPFPITCEIESIENEKYIRYKNIFHLTFSLNFTSNLYLPNYIGLGKGSSVGFGIINQIRVSNG